MSIILPSEVLISETIETLDPPPFPTVGPLMIALAATLIVGISHTVAGSNVWSFDCFITPGSHLTLGTGDHVMVYRHVQNSLIYPLPLPIFSAVLSKIVAWGCDHLEFQVKDITTGTPYPKTIKLPRSIVRLSTTQLLRNMLCPFPRLSTSPQPTTPHPSARPRFVGHKVIGDRVPRDSDDLPIWDSHRKL